MNTCLRLFLLLNLTAVAAVGAADPRKANIVFVITADQGYGEAAEQRSFGVWGQAVNAALFFCTHWNVRVKNAGPCGISFSSSNEFDSTKAAPTPHSRCKLSRLRISGWMTAAPLGSMTPTPKCAKSLGM
jgi:hypothetical protein